MIKFDLKNIMKDKKITLQKLSQKTGLSINTLSLLSTGKSKGIQFDTLNKIINALNCSIEDLIVVDDEYKIVEIYDVEKVDKEDILNYGREDNNIYFECTYLDNFYEEKILLLTFSETHNNIYTIYLAGELSVELFNTEKYLYIEEFKTDDQRNVKLDLLDTFMALIFKKMQEKNIFDFSRKSNNLITINYMPYKKSIKGSTLFTIEKLDTYDEKIISMSQLSKYIKIESYKLYISHEINEFEVLNSN
ncbi:helix-turn-helix domain-containing protein [Staphylococcus saprophyticus]